jgi:chaperone required for assembly of F1-ATPase
VIVAADYSEMSYAELDALFHAELTRLVAIIRPYPRHLRRGIPEVEKAQPAFTELKVAWQAAAWAAEVEAVERGEERSVRAHP